MGVFVFFSWAALEGNDLRVPSLPAHVTSRQNCLEQEDGMWTLITVTMVVTPVAGAPWQQIERLRCQFVTGRNGAQQKFGRKRCEAKIIWEKIICTKKTYEMELSYHLGKLHRDLYHFTHRFGP